METNSLIQASRLDNLDAIVGFIEECADLYGLAPKRKFGLLVAIEEVFVNVCHYAYPGGAGDVELSCSWDEDRFEVEIADHGIPFDILSTPEPDTTATIMDREIGGLGVHLIRTMTDEVNYRREAGRNILRLVLLTDKDAGHD